METVTDTNTKQRPPLVVGRVASATVRINKNDKGAWKPAQLIFSVVKDVIWDPTVQTPVAVIEDLFCDMPSAEESNMPHPTMGVGPRIALPTFFAKADKEKEGEIFARASYKDKATGEYKYLKPMFTKEVTNPDGTKSRPMVSFEEADRIDLRLDVKFPLVVKYSCRVSNKPDPTADGGWRQCTTWRGTKPRPVMFNGVIVDGITEHISMKPTSIIVVDRDPNVVEPAMKNTGIGQIL